MSLVNKVARKLCADDGFDPDWQILPDAATDAYSVWRNYTRQARAVLEVIRDPSDADFGGRFGSEARRSFGQMIDAALEPNS